MSYNKLFDATSTKLDLSNNSLSLDQIAKLDFSQFSYLEELNLSNLELLQLPRGLPITLKKLICCKNNFETRDSLLELASLINLEYLNCSDSNISSLECLPPNLKILICRENNLLSLNNLPPTLIILNCSWNNIRHLNYLPFGLQEIYCSNNSLEELPHLPPQLKVLDCSKCSINNLDNVPDSVEILYCFKNLITKFARLPSNLKELSCTGNPFIYKFTPTIRNIEKSNM
jgi:hypothetical protein